MLIDKQQINITEFHFKTCTYSFSVKMYSMEHLDNNYNAIFLYFSAFYQIFCERLLILKLLLFLYEAPCKPPCEVGHLVSSYIGIFTFGTSSIHFSTDIPGNDFIYIYITNLVCYTYFHWFFNPECQHIFGKQTGYIFQSPKKIKTWTTKHYASLNQWYNTE